MDNKSEREKLKKQAGFTLVEILVAMAIFSLIAVPLTSSFIISSRLNRKGRVIEQANTIAQNTMEGIKNFGLAELSEQCHTRSGDSFTIIAGGSGVTASELSLTPSYASGSFQAHATVPSIQNTITLLNGTVVTGTFQQMDEDYVFEIRNVLLGSSHFDVKIRISQDKDPEKNLATFKGTDIAGNTYDYAKNYSEWLIRPYMSYIVKIEVSEHNSATIAATYDGTFTDQN